MGDFEEALYAATKHRAVRDAAIRMACWVALGNDPIEARRSVTDHVLNCAWRYFEARGFGPDPQIEWPEVAASPEHTEVAEIVDLVKGSDQASDRSTA